MKRPQLGRSDICRPPFGERSYRIDRGVFHPEKHLSGLVFADFLRKRDWANNRIVELGTGCGLLAGVLADGGADVVAIDVSAAAVECARANLADTSVDVRLGDLLEPVRGERFDLIVTNPPYEVGRSLRPKYRSPDFLERLASQWPTVADQLILAFPTDSADALVDLGFDVQLIARIESAGRELGVFQG